MKYVATLIGFVLTSCFSISTHAQFETTLLPVAKGWSKNSVNTVVFRKNALTSNDSIQFIAFYDSTGHVVIGKRRLNEHQWIVKTTEFTGHVNDAHNSISIALDGNGHLHMSWDHHNSELKYAISKQPLSMNLEIKEAMIGINEHSVTYPEFHNFPDGDLLFLYRDGESGRGNLVLNRYSIKAKQWVRIQDNLINGEGQRSAYWQCTIDQHGKTHLSWVWRETWDVATNHDLCYATSEDGGITWQKATGEKYELPITMSNAEIAWNIPQKSELINQTSMATDEDGKPYIASYWKDNGSLTPQYQLVFFHSGKWQKQTISNRSTSFSLSGGGTKSIPISRPQIAINKKEGFLLFRDEEKGNNVSLYHSSNILSESWESIELTSFPVGSWEPNYDIQLWNKRQALHVFVQETQQGDNETLIEVPATMVYVLEFN